MYLLHWLPVKSGTEYPLAENHPCRSMNEHHNSLRTHLLRNSSPRVGVVAHDCNPSTQDDIVTGESRVQDQTKIHNDIMRSNASL